MMRVLVIGSINMDMVIQTERVPELGETVSGSGFEAICGGKGANQAVAAARMGCQTAMIGAVGTDVPGTQLLDALGAEGIDLRGVKRVEGASGVAVITVCEGDNRIILDAGANATVSPADIDAHIDLLRWADVVLLQFEIPMETVAYAAQRAQEEGCAVIVNPAPMCENLDRAILKAADVFVPNASEAALLTGMPVDSWEEAEAAREAIRAMGAMNVVITLGSLGAVLSDGELTVRQKAYPAKAVDTTAAGDSFIGALASRLDEGIVKACDYAAGVSALTVGRKGAQRSIPTAAEVAQIWNGQEAQ